jgi:hypothetical protein
MQTPAVGWSFFLIPNLMVAEQVRPLFKKDFVRSCLKCAGYGLYAEPGGLTRDFAGKTQEKELDASISLRFRSLWCAVAAGFRGKPNLRRGALRAAVCI